MLKADIQETTILLCVFNLAKFQTETINASQSQFPFLPVQAIKQHVVSTISSIAKSSNLLLVVAIAVCHSIHLENQANYR